MHKALLPNLSFSFGQMIRKRGRIQRGIARVTWFGLTLTRLLFLHVRFLLLLTHVGRVKSVYIRRTLRYSHLEVWNSYVAMTTLSLHVMCAWFERTEKSNVISGGDKEQNLKRQEEVLVRVKQCWCLHRSQTLKGSTFQAFIQRNLALQTRRTLNDVMCLLPFCTPYMVCHENVMWCAWQSLPLPSQTAVVEMAETISWPDKD